MRSRCCEGLWIGENEMSTAGAQGKLTIVPTPVGNLGDITLRALEVLRSADLILAEDTRTSSVLLKHYDVKKPLESHHKFNEFKTSSALVARIQEGLNVVLISDAGTPGVSDPGIILAQACIEAEVPVECLPGATAFVPALVVSGLDASRFVFEGFLPQKKGRHSRIQALAEEERTVILYESPFRVLKTLQAFAEVCGGERKAVAVRELTKVYEEVCRGTLQELIDHFTEVSPRGEFVLLIAGAPHEKKIHKSYRDKLREENDNLNSN